MPAVAALWRVFPWDASAEAGAPFSREFVPHRQSTGRFDLGGQPSVLYFAESPEHAVGEVLQGFRGRRITARHLRRSGKPLALVDVALAQPTRDAVVDLTDPAALARHAIRPDELASHDRARTQAVARRIHAAGAAGLRWWSSLTGEWHSVILFLDRVGPGDLTYGTPRPVDLSAPVVLQAASILGIGIRRS